MLVVLLGNANKLGNKEAGQYVTNDKFAVITGTTTIGASTDSAITFNYPTNFNQSNCVPIACGLKVTESKGYNYTGNYVDVTSPALNAYSRDLNLLSDKIQLFIRNTLTSAKTFSYQIVLMKIS